MLLLEGSATTTFSNLLMLDKKEENNIYELMPMMLINNLKTFNETFDELKSAVFSNLFDDIIKKTIDKNKSNLTFALSLVKLLPNMNKNIKIKTLTISNKDIQELKRQAKEAFGVENEDDIYIDMQELLKQMGKDLDLDDEDFN